MSADKFAKYARGWNAIKEQVRKRIDAIQGVGNVYDFVTFVREYPDTKKWKQRFESSGIPNFWTIHLMEVPQDKISEEDQSIYVTRYKVALIGIFGYTGTENNTEDWNALTARVVRDIVRGDRTFANTCLTCSIPTTSEYNTTEMQGKTCHQMAAMFEIEEVYCATDFATLYSEPGHDVPDSDPNYALSQGVALGDRLIESMAGVHDELELALPVHWARNTDEKASSYPPNPYLMCPRLRLDLVTENIEQGDMDGGMGHNGTYKFVFSYDRLQVPGENHQRELKKDMEQIVNLFLSEQFQPNALNYSRFSIIAAVPSEQTIHPEKKHEWDDPALRISTGDILVEVTGKASACVE